MQLRMTILDPFMSLERIKKIFGLLGVVDTCQLLLKTKKWSLEMGKKYTSRGL